MMDFLITVGHLGKDTGAVSPFDADDEAGIEMQQQERWINLQQVLGFMSAYLGDGGEKPDIKLAIPKGYIKNLCMDHALIEVDDDNFSLKDRVDLANKLGRNLIEFHNNSAGFKAFGAEVICYSERSAGHTLGKLIMAQLELAGMKNRGVKTLEELGRDLYLIRKTAKVAIILEGGFLSDKRDATNIDVDLDFYNEQYGVLVYQAVRTFWNSTK
jgi:N-acetylmuramoyl-L-alanine amidase